MSDHYEIRVYIAGMTATARRTLGNLEKLRARLPGDLRLDIRVINILENPQVAEDEKVIATPMVVKYRPEPVRRIIGDLSSETDALAGLDLDF